MTPPSRCAALCRIEPELAGLPGKVTRDTKRRHRFVVHAAGWLHSNATSQEAIIVGVEKHDDGNWMT